MAERQWDKFEAALLIDTYNAVDSGAFKRDIAVAKLSNNLRKRAENLGLTVDSKYRNINIVSYMLSSLLYFFTNGKNKAFRVTNPVFHTVYGMYQNNRDEFNSILEEAKKQCSDGFNVQSVSLKTHIDILEKDKTYGSNPNLNNTKDLLKLRYIDYCEKKGKFSGFDPKRLLHWLDMLDLRLRKLKVINASIFDINDYEKFCQFKNTNNFNDVVATIIGRFNIFWFLSFLNDYIKYVDALSYEDKQFIKSLNDKKDEVVVIKPSETTTAEEKKETTLDKNIYKKMQIEFTSFCKEQYSISALIVYDNLKLLLELEKHLIKDGLISFGIFDYRDFSKLKDLAKSTKRNDLKVYTKKYFAGSRATRVDFYYGILCEYLKNKFINIRENDSNANDIIIAEDKKEDNLNIMNNSSLNDFNEEKKEKNKDEGVENTKHDDPNSKTIEPKNNNIALTKYEANLKDLEDAIGVGPFYEYYKNNILSNYKKTMLFNTVNNIYLLKQAIHVHFGFDFTCASPDSLDRLKELDDCNKIKPVLRLEYPRKCNAIYLDFKIFIRAFLKWEEQNKKQIVKNNEEKGEIEKGEQKSPVVETLDTQIENLTVVVQEKPIVDIKLVKLLFAFFLQSKRKLKSDTIAKYMPYLDMLNDVLLKDGIIQYGVYYTQELGSLIQFRNSDKYTATLKQHFAGGVRTLVGFYFDYLIEYLKQKNETGNNKEIEAGLVGVSQNEGESRIDELVNTLKVVNVSELNKTIANDHNSIVDDIQNKDEDTTRQETKPSLQEKIEHENNTLNDNRKVKQQISTEETNDLLIETLKEMDLKYVDKRSKGGCLWVEGGPFDESKLNELKKLGAKFSFASMSGALGYRDGWWTKDIINELPNEDIKISDHNEFSGLLKSDDYSLLRSALLSDGITTIDELKKLKLWPYLNELNLYTINKRQEIFASVQKLLEDLKKTEPFNYKLVVGSDEYFGVTPAESFLRFCERISSVYPLKFRTLIGKLKLKGVSIIKLTGDSSYLKMDHPVAYIPSEMSEEMCLEGTELLCRVLMNEPPKLSIYKSEVDEEDRENVIVPATVKETQKIVLPQININPVDDTLVETKYEQEKKISCSNDKTATVNEVNSPINPTSDVAPVTVEVAGKDETKYDSESESVLADYQKTKIAEIENIVSQADLDGMDYHRLKETIKITMGELRELVQKSSKLVEINSLVFHVDAFVDWDEGATALGSILEKLMQKNNGYVSAIQLYDFARVEMSMFLNDNGINNERAVFDIAQNLFGEGTTSKKYNFVGKTHISELNVAIKNNFDIFCRYAEEFGGVVKVADLVEYLNSVNVKTGNLNAQLRIQSDSKFFYYDEHTLIYGPSMHIDEQWMETVKSALMKLFADVGDHIILRDINEFWYSKLPTLPKDLNWTPLLLQGILRFYGEDLNAKTIMAMEGQSFIKLHSMLVSEASPIQNFGDAVISYLEDNDIEQRLFDAEELRQLLVDAKMLQGNELIYNMPKALARDERFSWDLNGTEVRVLI